jgi:hypothetical protein
MNEEMIIPNVQNLTYEISELIYNATHPEEFENEE